MDRKIWKIIVVVSVILILGSASFLFVNFFKYKDLLDNSDPVPNAINTLWPYDNAYCQCMHTLTNGGVENWWFNKTHSQRTKKFVGFN